MTRQVNSQQEQFSRDSTELGGTSLATQAQCPRPEYDNNMNNTTVGNKISLFYVSL